MMRPVTCLSLMVALGAGLYLYQVKHRAQLLDRDINRTVKQAEQARERIGLLKAEWALLEEPQRLGELAAHHLTLQALAPNQFVRLEDLPGRLPAPSIAAPPAPGPAAEPPMAAAAPEPSQPPRPSLVAQLPAAPAHLPPRPAKPAPAVAADKPLEPRPLYAPVMPAYVPNTTIVRPPTIRNASATMAAAAPPPAYVGSMLGTSRTALAPPIPIGGAGGASLASATSLGYAPNR